MEKRDCLLVASYSSDKRLAGEDTVILDENQIRKAAITNGTKYSSNVTERNHNQFLTRDMYLLSEGCFSVAISRRPSRPSGFNGMLIKTYSLTQEGSDKIADELGLPRVTFPTNSLDSKLDDEVRE